MKKILIIITSILLVVILVIITVLSIQKNRVEEDYIKEINNGNYSISYWDLIHTNIPLVVNNRTIEISGVGQYVIKEGVYGDDTIRYTYGDFDTDELKGFALKAIRSGIYEMPETMDAENIADGSYVEFILVIGDKEIILNGNNRTLVDEKFNKIIDELFILFDDVEFTSYIEEQS